LQLKAGCNWRPRRIWGFGGGLPLQLDAHFSRLARISVFVLFFSCCGGLLCTTLMALFSNRKRGSVAVADCSWKWVVAASARNFGFSAWVDD
jgi:hypothetical protein